MPILVSRRLGPAVVGFLRSAIVVPDWALALDRRMRELLLLHEREHLRAGDPRLLLAAGALVLLIPWNVVLWWQLRRLRLAVEVDCDARVLRRRPDRHAYGMLLLDVGQRSSSPPLAGAALSEPRSFLERRIRTMTHPKRKHPWLSAATFAVVAVSMAAVACETPAPDALTSTAGEEPAATQDAQDLAVAPTVTPFEVAPELINRDEAVQTLKQVYPPPLRDAGIGGRVMVWFFIDETGRVKQARVKESSGREALDQAALKAAKAMEFSPALNRDEPVPVWVAMPITFQPSEGEGGA